MKKILALMFVVLLTVALFGACGKKDASDSTSSDSLFSTADVNFIDADGGCAYIITRPEKCDAEISEAASGLYRKMKEVLTVNSKNKSDAEDGDGVAEILVGDTNRNASRVAKEYLLSEGTGRADEYIICTVDEDIAIVGTTIKSTLAAIEYFTENILPQKTVAGGINHLNSNPDKYENIALFGNDNLYGIEIVRPIYNVSYITQQEIDKLINLVEEKTGYLLTLVNDNNASNTGNKLDGSGTLTPSTPAEYQIIIGNCARDGVKTITDKNEYEIRIEEKAVYLNGGSPYATALAVTEFCKMFSNNDAITADMSVADGDYDYVVATYDSAEYYYPTWKEDFESNNIDDLYYWTVRWDESAGYGDTGKPCYRGNSQAKNNYIRDGKLYMEALETNKGYYGGMIDTRGRLAFLYGYMEISDLHPKGEGFWSALWTVSYGNTVENPMALPTMDYLYYSETDIDECYGEGTWAYGNTFAWPTGVGKQHGLTTVHVNNRVTAEDDRGFYMDFHTYGFEWPDEKTVRFTCDGKVYAEQSLREGEQEAYRQAQWLKLSLAVGTENHPITDNKDEWQNTNTFITDWVYIYQKRGQRLFFGEGGGNKMNIDCKWHIQERQ